jgi:hypothetical protein
LDIKCPALWRTSYPIGRNAKRQRGGGAFFPVLGFLKLFYFRHSHVAAHYQYLLWRRLCRNMALFADTKISPAKSEQLDAGCQIGNERRTIGQKLPWPGRTPKPTAEFSAWNPSFRHSCKSLLL